MLYITIGAVVFGIAGVAAAGWFYYHLWRWAKDCETAALVIAYKRKVVMSPTLVELLLWARKVPKDRNGQTFYKGPNVTVAIVKPLRKSARVKKTPAQAESRTGTWSMGDKPAS